MELWFGESNHKGYRHSFQIKETLLRMKSKYQDIAVFDTQSFGKMLVLDDCVMLTEYDEFMYHEMLVHPSMCVHPKPKNILIIGGGDGGTAREIIRYKDIESIDIIEIDKDVVKVCRELFPSLSNSLNSEKVNILYEDGIQFVKNTTKLYDIIFVDSTDPVGFASQLVSVNFYSFCSRILKDDGILSIQSESPFVHKKEIKNLYKNIRCTFSNVFMYLGSMPSYPSGQWSYGFASKKYHPLRDFIPKKLSDIGQELQFYNAEIHHSCFALPNMIKHLIDSKVDV